MELCRLCYSETPLELCKNIYFTQTEDPPILDLILKLVDLKLDENDPYSKNICFNCHERLINFRNFRQIVLETDRKFRHLFNNFNGDCSTIKTEKGLDDAIVNNTVDAGINYKVEIKEITENSCESSEKVVEDLPGSIVIDKKADINDKNNTCKTQKIGLDCELNKNGAQNVCHICGKIYAYGHFDVHLRTHTGEKPYKCDICNKRFTTASSLKSHVRLHTGEKPYRCDYCNETFTQSPSLYYHLKIHTAEGPYKCQICNKTFTRRFSLNMHSKVHAGDKPFECQFCKKLFSRKNHLEVHLTLHGDQKPFECNFCNRKYTHKAYVTRHQMKCAKRSKI